MQIYMLKHVRKVSACHSYVTERLSTMLDSCKTENYHYGNVFFSLFDFKGQRDDLKSIQLMTDPF